jgi:hypothetical protein
LTFIFFRGVETTNQRRLQLNLGCNSVLKHRLTELEEMLQVGWDRMVAMGRFPHGISMDHLPKMMDLMGFNRI